MEKLFTKKLKILSHISFFFLLLSILLQVYVTNKLSIKGIEILTLNQSRQKLEKEISKIEHEISALSSLSYIEREARTSGFVDIKGGVSVIYPATVASAINQEF